MTSIRRELLLTLLSAVLIAGCVAALAVYYRVRDETGEVLDYQLRQMALAVRDETLQGVGAFKPPPFGFDYAIQISGRDGIEVYYARSHIRLPQMTASGYSTLDSTDGPWRVYTLRERGLTVQIAQPMHVRSELAARAAWRTITPFILLLPLLAALVWLAVTRGLRPLATVANAVKARSPTSLEPLPDVRVPEEIRSVVLALNELLPRVSRALEMQRTFIADAAHELRSPLTALRLQLQLAERAHDDTQRTAAFAALRQGLERTTHLVEQLLTLARENPSNTRREIDAVDIGGLAAEAVAAHGALAESKSIDLGLARRDADLVMQGEREALRTLISNLVDNAVRYTPAGGRVDVRAFRDDQCVVIEVTDTGPGIPHVERVRVFDRFYRRSGTGEAGSGLGLAIVRSIAERHGATVELNEGPEHHGLTARVSFPLRPA